jgi:DNA-binding CsgD family transcriptional regulator
MAFSTLKHQLDCLDGAAVLLTQDGRVMALNGEAERALYHLPYFRLHGRYFQFRETRDQDELFSALENAFAADGPRMSAFPLAGSGTPAAVALLIPLASARNASHTVQRTHALLSIRRAYPEPIPHNLLRRLFGLTLSESEVANAVISGLKLASAARQLGISPTTARNQMSSVMGKVGVHRQAELVARLVAILPRLKLDQGLSLPLFDANAS